MSVTERFDFIMLSVLQYFELTYVSSKFNFLHVGI